MTAKMSIRGNEVYYVDYCLQGLKDCEMIYSACCGHGNDVDGYILFKDGRLFKYVGNVKEELSEEKDSLVAVIDENLLKGEHELSIKHKEAKDKMKKGESSEVSAILDVIFYWRGYIKALEELKEGMADEEETV